MLDARQPHDAQFMKIPKFRTDGLKIYPMLVIREMGLYELWRTGRYTNYTLMH